MQDFFFHFVATKEKHIDVNNCAEETVFTTHL